MIRRVAVVIAVVTVAGCSLREAFSGHPDVVARAAGVDLTVERLASILAPAKTVPLQPDSVGRRALAQVTDLWIDYQLLAQAVVSGDTLLDSATVMAASWPLVAQYMASRLHDTLIVSRAVATTQQVDSAYNAGDFRYLYHILVQVRSDTADAVRAAKRRQAERILAQLRGGANFQQLARRVSNDTMSGRHGGLLGMIGRGVTVRPFEEAAFALAPGALSDVVETAFGYHVIWRPSLEAVRDSFAEQVRSLLIEQLDSAFLDSLVNRTAMRVRGSAPAMAKEAARDLWRAKRRDRVMATWRGGRLRERDFAQWIQAYPLQVRGQILTAPDSVLTEFVRNIARNTMLIQSAERMGIRITPEQADTVRSRFRRDLSGMLSTMGIAPESIAADTTLRGRSPAEIAAARVDAYFTALTSDPASRPYFEVPPYLADVLRSRFDWSVSQPGIQRALERARELRGPETPFAPPGMPQMEEVPRGVQPAPGGPPVGGRGRQ